MSMTFEERRKTLADFLEFEVQPRLDGAKFDMEMWGYAEKPLSRDTQITQLSECSFAGCAAGWSYFCPALREEGVPVGRTVNRLALMSSTAELGLFFGLDRPHHIFDPGCYPDPEVTILEVVARLRATL